MIPVPTPTYIIYVYVIPVIYQLQTNTIILIHTNNCTTYDQYTPCISKLVHCTP